MIPLIECWFVKTKGRNYKTMFGENHGLIHSFVSQCFWKNDQFGLWKWKIKKGIKKLVGPTINWCAQIKGGYVVIVFMNLLDFCRLTFWIQGKYAGCWGGYNLGQGEIALGLIVEGFEVLGQGKSGYCFRRLIVTVPCHLCLLDVMKFGV